MVRFRSTRVVCLGSSAELVRFADRSKVCGREIGSRVEGTSLLTIRLKGDPIVPVKKGMSVRCFWKIAQTWIMQQELCQVDDHHDDDGDLRCDRTSQKRAHGGGRLQLRKRNDETDRCGLVLHLCLLFKHRCPDLGRRR
jgi:hypothetical protein